MNTEEEKGKGKPQETRERKMEYINNINRHPEIYKPFLIIICLSVVQQFSGASIIRAYVVKIFDEVIHIIMYVIQLCVHTIQLFIKIPYSC